MKTTMYGQVPWLAALAMVACGGGEPDPGSEAELAASAVSNEASGRRVVGRAGTSVALDVGSGSPVIERVRITPFRPKPGESVVALVQVDDPDGDEVELGYTWSLGGRMLSGGGSDLEIPTSAKPEQELRVRVIATDGRNSSEPAFATATLENRSPEVLSVAFENPSAAPGEALRLVVEANDPDGQPLEREIRWFVDDEFEEKGGVTFETRGLDRGDRVHAEVRVSDGDERSPAMVSEKVTIGNSEPEVVSAPGELDEDGTFRYAIEVEDPDGDRSFRYTLVEAPEGMSLDPVVGELSWTPTLEDEGVHWIEVKVADRHGGVARQRFDLTIGVAESQAISGNQQREWRQRRRPAPVASP